MMSTKNAGSRRLVGAITATAALFGTVAVALMVLPASPAKAQSTLEQAREEGYIRVGFANEAPFGFATTAGELTGEAPEVAKAVLDKMGISEVDGVLTEFGSLIPGLNAGRFDVIAAGMFITPKRCEQIDFSEPTYKLAQAFLVPEGNPKNLQTYEDIAANPELMLAVLTGAVEKGYAEQAGVEEAQLVTLPDPPSMLAAVQAGRADAAALTTLSISNLAEKGEGVEMTEPITEAGGESVVGYGAFGFREDDDALREAFNEQLKGFIGSEEHKKLVSAFGFGRDYMIPDKTTEEICGAAYDAPQEG
jgi:polar amino acid transport system substrate-binding protein